MAQTIRASRKPKKIWITGQKDPRGPDNSLTVWIDDDGSLRIMLEKPALRCYQFSHIEETASHITVIQNK